jgi:hypothetical protein
MLLRGKITLAVVSAALIVGGIFSAKKYIIPEGEKAQDISGLMSAGSAKPGQTPTNKCIEIGVNTWGGFVGGQYWNGGFKDNAASKFREDGICVNFHKMDDLVLILGVVSLVGSIGMVVLRIMLLPSSVKMVSVSIFTRWMTLPLLVPLFNQDKWILCG